MKPNNLVAKHAHKFNRAVVIPDKREYNRKIKHKKDPTLDAVYESALDLYTSDLISEDRFNEFVKICRKESSEKMVDKITSIIDKSLVIECIDDSFLDRGDWRPIVEELVHSVLNECISVIEDPISINLIKEHFNIQ